jgi:DNA-binding transcriptional LysR family regulator
MNLRFIEAFVWVARLRGFTAAAKKLYTTQAAISARIATLEDDFGVKLFERDKRTVALTHSGEELLGYAEQLLGVSARMVELEAQRLFGLSHVDCVTILETLLTQNFLSLTTGGLFVRSAHVR